MTNMTRQSLKVKSKPAEEPIKPLIPQKENPEILTPAKIESEIPQKPIDALNMAKLAVKLSKVMQTCSHVPKDKANSVQHYKYVSSDAILEKVNEALSDQGLATFISLDVLDRQPRTTNTGAMWELCTVKVTITIIDSETGFSLETEGIGQGYDNGDKALSKAQTQGRKYAWMLALQISTGDDPEGDIKTDAADLAPNAPVGNDGTKIKCPHCGSVAYFMKNAEAVDIPVKVYFCDHCKKESRIKA